MLGESCFRRVMQATSRAGRRLPVVCATKPQKKHGMGLCGYVGNKGTSLLPPARGGDTLPTCERCTDVRATGCTQVLSWRLRFRLLGFTVQSFLSDGYPAVGVGVPFTRQVPQTSYFGQTLFSLLFVSRDPGSLPFHSSSIVIHL